MWVETVESGFLQGSGLAGDIKVFRPQTQRSAWKLKSLYVRCVSGGTQASDQTDIQVLVNGLPVFRGISGANPSNNKAAWSIGPGANEGPITTVAYGAGPGGTDTPNLYAFNIPHGIVMGRSDGIQLSWGSLVKIGRASWRELLL